MQSANATARVGVPKLATKVPVVCSMMCTERCVRLVSYADQTKQETYSSCLLLLVMPLLMIKRGKRQRKVSATAKMAPDHGSLKCLMQNDRFPLEEEKEKRNHATYIR